MDNDQRYSVFLHQGMAVVLPHVTLVKEVMRFGGQYGFKLQLRDSADVILLYKEKIDAENDHLLLIGVIDEYYKKTMGLK